MPLFRLIILGIIIGAGIYIYRRLKQHSQKPAKKQEKSTAIVKCEKCGVHIPKDEAITVGDQHYCCPEHSKHHTDNH